MNPQQLLDLYDQKRREIAISGFELQATPNVVRYVSTVGRQSMVLYSHHTPDRIEAAIDTEIRYFEKIGHSFEWKVYSHDQPPDLKERLAARGFEVGEDEAFLVLDILTKQAEFKAPLKADVRRITTPDNLSDLLAIEQGVWAESDREFHKELAHVLQHAPETIGIYVAYVDDKPVSSARITFSEGSPFAGLWGGSTLPEYRGRGLYTALIAARAQQAMERGVRFLTVDALPTSRPILERRGFRFLASTNPCLWRNAAQN